ncbi:MAG: retroviral-like aspartic protease family protein [Brevundimonas sp.]|uniref:retroviral-like aspartic protease family protein n=1 Tax=Brevundimonas sp. TaxID=1871086 RepID=UPI002628C348|nr:retroviral-like aspartic protease family protein [Brevundimonas sp.]MDI6625188.1 retroviral-like aspartic protease family protein [Brevundimonas sp.]MDQ7813558.1 retroviral-like aspartic protease family protein [Brevundimonas sp.]
MALGLAGVVATGPGPLFGQDPEGGEPRLLANLLTRMALRVTINGRRGAVFVLDTGAGRTVISEDLAQTWGLPPRPPVLVHGLTAAQLAPTVHINRLSLGGRRIHDLEAPIFPRRLIAADGLLGLDVLGRFRLDLNIARRHVRMRPSGPDVVAVGSAGYRATRLRTEERPARHGRFGVLILTGLVEGREVDVFVDTGAQYSIGNLALLRSVGGDPAGLQRVTVYGVTGQVLAAASGQVRDLRLGTQRLGPTPLLFADLHAFEVLDLVERPALLIGADLLYRFREVTLDFGRSRMAFRGLRRTG